MKSAKMLALASLLASSPVSMSACDRDAPIASEDVGDARLELVVQGGATLNAVAFTVVGPPSFGTRSGSFDVSRSSTISGSLTLPAGGPYTVTLGSTSSDGATTCNGISSFSVVARTTTPVTVNLLCHENTRLGSVLLSGALNVCPVIDGLSATPAEIIVGSPLALAAFAHDSDAAPAALTYAWSSPSGTFSDTAMANPTFTCSSAGAVLVTLVVSDGDTTAGCSDTKSVSVICSPSSN